MMKKMNFVLIILLILFSISALFIGGCSHNVNVKDPVDYVNPNTGTIGHLLTAVSPYVQLPHGMVRLAPNTTPGITDRYLADKIYSFPLGHSWIMSIKGNLILNATEIASEFDHDFETVTPYYAAVLLEDYDIEVEYTVTEHAAYYRFTFPEASDSHILMGSNAKVNILSDHVIEGEESGAYFYAEFNKLFDNYGTWKDEEIYPEIKTQSGNNIGAFTNYTTSEDEQIEVKIGISYIDIHQARQNLEQEIPAWDFEQVKNRAKSIWDESLGKIQVKGGTEKERTIFYTALYRSMGRMINITEYGHYYSGFDNQVHTTDGYDFYNNDGLWDTYRCLHPLQMIMEPERRIDILTSYVRMYEQCGWMPSFPNVGGGGNSNPMIGHHATAMIADSYMKGFRDFDIEKAYEGMKKNAMKKTMLSRFRGDGLATELDSVYFEKGFFPALPPEKEEWVPQVNPVMRRQSVSITLEHCYDDWALAQLAQVLGKTEDYEYFIKRAHNYQNVFDSGTGFMRPKNADGRWVEPFDPIWSGGQGGRDYYTENNSWNYTWHVQHDVQGLINLMGGREKFIDKLNTLFTTNVPLFQKYHFLALFPDMTGWIGMYAQGNEPCFHIPYLYNYAGAPWRTQRRVRDIMEIWYGAGPLGICGDEDGGAMSSWYVFSAMGFYPVCPGRPVYDICSPIFKKVTIDVGNGKTFMIEAKNVSEQNKYIQSASLNGHVHNKPWFEHSDLINGGTLVLNMGPRPNKQWGSEPSFAPPSMFDE